MLVTVGNRFCHLSEKGSSFALRKASAPPHIIMHVALAEREENINVFGSENHFSHTGDVRVRRESSVRGHHLWVALGRINLDRTKQKGNKKVAPQTSSQPILSTPHLFI